jgi:hypothetical protein
VSSSRAQTATVAGLGLRIADGATPVVGGGSALISVAPAMAAQA